MTSFISAFSNTKSPAFPAMGLTARAAVAEFLERRPTDLTAIAKANSGEFPVARLTMIIDGREDVAQHGPRTMPVWGERYRSLADDAGIEDTEDEVRMRIDALVHYIESLQDP